MNEALKRMRQNTRGVFRAAVSASTVLALLGGNAASAASITERLDNFLVRQALRERQLENTLNRATELIERGQRVLAALERTRSFVREELAPALRRLQPGGAPTQLPSGGSVRVLPNGDIEIRYANATPSVYTADRIRRWQLELDDHIANQLAQNIRADQEFSELTHRRRLWQDRAQRIRDILRQREVEQILRQQVGRPGIGIGDIFPRGGHIIALAIWFLQTSQALTEEERAWQRETEAWAGTVRSDHRTWRHAEANAELVVLEYALEFDGGLSHRDADALIERYNSAHVLHPNRPRIDDGRRAQQPALPVLPVHAVVMNLSDALVRSGIANEGLRQATINRIQEERRRIHAALARYVLARARIGTAPIQEVGRPVQFEADAMTLRQDTLPERWDDDFRIGGGARVFIHIGAPGPAGDQGENLAVIVSRIRGYAEESIGNETDAQAMARALRLARGRHTTAQGRAERSIRAQAASVPQGSSNLYLSTWAPMSRSSAFPLDPSVPLRWANGEVYSSVSGVFPIGDRERFDLVAP